MMNKRNINKPGWIERFVEIENKKLLDKPLDQSEQDFLTGIDMSNTVLPGVLTDELLGKMVEILNDVKSEMQSEIRVAARDNENISELLQNVYDLIKQNESELEIVIRGKKIAILKIDSENSTVQPVYIEGIDYTVSEHSGTVRKVDPYGGINLSFEQLKNMEIETGNDSIKIVFVK